MYLRYGDLSWDTMEADTAAAVSPRPGRAGVNGHSVSRNGRGYAAHLPVVRLNGVELHAITEAGCIKYILDRLEAGYGGVVVTPNLDHLRRCVSDMNFAALVAEADLVVADGMPLVWASKLQGTPLPERVAGSDLLSSLSAAAFERGRSLFLMGGAPGTAEGAARVLQQRHSGIRILGTHCPPFGFDKNEQQLQEMEQMLAENRPDIVYVALGSPKQELLIDRLRKTLPHSWFLGVGNSFSFLSGEVRRAPLWMQRHGLEWIHRLLQEPRRLFRRYIVLGVPFATSLLGRAMVKGLPKRLGRQSETDLDTTGEMNRSLVVTPATDIASDITSEQMGPVARQRPLPLSDDLPGSNGNGAGVTDRLNDGIGDLNGRSRISSPAAIDVDDIGSNRASGSNGYAGLFDSLTAERSTGLEKLRALVLLGGSVRPTSLSTSIGRAVLDLPLDDSGSILNHWVTQASDLRERHGLEKLPVRVLVDWNSPEPSSTGPSHFDVLRVERDRTEYRGTGGVLHDLAGDYADDDLILVANAQQVMLDPIWSLAAALNQMQADVSLVSHLDGTPSGLMLVRCGTLRLIPRAGFVDMKEQALPAIASRFNVKVMPRKRPTGLPVRSLADYIMALRHYHRRRIGTPGPIDPLAEDWRPAFAIIEDGAVVDPLARVHDSVVLRGGRIEPGAVLVRSIVCPGGVVRRDRSAVDQFVTDAPERSSQRRE
jgi:N-acetylglucosaminyldiphosphoundecaprenol N-acetyl-beta-D-mannosaminyltransferase